MKVRVTIGRRTGQSVEHVAEVQRNGDVIRAARAAAEAYRAKHHEVPLFDHSTIKIERV